MSRTWPVLAAMLSIGLAANASAQPSQAQSAQQNVRESQQYQQLLCANPGFRARRVERECGPVTDPELHAQCLQSFGCGPPPPIDNAPPPSETVR